MRILIVAPKYIEKVGEHYQFPLGLGYISSALKNAGFDVQCLNCNHDHPSTGEQVLQAVLRLQPDVVATGGLSPYLNEVRAVFDSARLAKPDVINIVGGGVLSSDPEVGILSVDADFGVIGEGEITIVELCRALEAGGDVSKIDGLIYVTERGGGKDKVRRTPERKVVMDLGTIAWPDYEGLGVEHLVEGQISTNNYFYHTEEAPRCIDMVTSRSCPYSCTFCFHPSGKVYRERPLDDFFAELDHVVKKYKINMVAVVDELFSLRKSRLVEFCNRIKPFNISWMVQLHVNSADEEILQLMRDSGCTYISYGIESMSPTVLDSMKKKAKKERIEDVMERTWRNRIGIQGNMIFGDTAETIQTANETMHWWASHRDYQININSLIVYPGSPDYIEAVRDGLITNRDEFVNDGRYLINISKMNDTDMNFVRWLVSSWTVTMVIPATQSHIESTGEFHPTRGPTYNINWQCPRCAHSNVYAKIPFDHVGSSVRLTCRCCRARADVPNTVRFPRRSPEVEQYLLSYYHQGEALVASGMLKEAELMRSRLERILPDNPWSEALSGLIKMKNNLIIPALQSFFLASSKDLYNPEPHYMIGELMGRLGLTGAARMHYEQTLRLKPDHAKASMMLRLMGSRPSEPEAFFCSVSPDPAHARPERAAPVKKKRIPDFSDLEPDMARA